MKKATIVIALVLTIAGTARAANRYGWAISSSLNDAYVSTGPVTGAPLVLYLWLGCAYNDGMSAMEADFQTPPGVFVFGFNPMNGFLNAGTATYLLLAVGGCPHGPVLTGSWSVFNTAAGTYCLVPSNATGTLGTVDCSVSPSLWPMDVQGYGAGVLPSCIDISHCVIPSVRPSSWGEVKSLYR